MKMNMHSNVTWDKILTLMNEKVEEAHGEKPVAVLMRKLIETGIQENEIESTFKYLEKINVAHLNNDIMGTKLPTSDQRHIMFVILDHKKFQELRKKYRDEVEKLRQLPTKPRMITQEGDTLYYKGRRLEMAKLAQIILTLFFNPGLGNGILEYETIENNLIKNDYKEYTDVRARNRRIQDAFGELKERGIGDSAKHLFRYIKIGGKNLKNEAKPGTPLIEIKRGRGIQLNNLSQ